MVARRPCEPHCSGPFCLHRPVLSGRAEPSKCACSVIRHGLKVPAGTAAASCVEARWMLSRARSRRRERCWTEETYAGLGDRGDHLSADRQRILGARGRLHARMIHGAAIGSYRVGDGPIGRMDPMIWTPAGTPGQQTSLAGTSKAGMPTVPSAGSTDAPGSTSLPMRTR